MEQRELIEGKPHFGLWFGQCVLNLPETEGNPEHDPIYLQETEKLEMNVISKLPKECEVRGSQITVRPAYRCTPLLLLSGSVAIKYMIWGRAYRVMGLLKKGTKRYAKRIVGGKMKRVRIDRRNGG